MISIKFQFVGFAYNVPRIRVADEDLVMEQPVYEEMMRKLDNISYSWASHRSK